MRCIVFILICVFVYTPTSIIEAAEDRSVEIIIESDGLIPSFYNGRAHPAAGNTLKATAIIDLSSRESVSRFQYVWEVDGRVIEGGSVQGLSTINLTAPEKRSIFISVTVRTADGILIGTKNTIVPLVEPEVVFYEDNPLRGLSRNALRESFTIIAQETAIRAVPYFMQTNIFALDPYTFWRVDGRDVSTLDGMLDVISLIQGDAHGTSRIEFSVQNKDTLTQSADNTFILHF